MKSNKMNCFIATRLSIYGVLCFHLLTSSCASKKQYGAHFPSPNINRISTFHQLKQKDKAIIKGFQNYEQITDTLSLNRNNDSTVLAKKKTDNAIRDSSGLNNPSNGRFFVSRARVIINHDDPRLDEKKRSRLRRFEKYDKEKGVPTQEPFGPLSLLLLPLIIQATSFSLILAGAFFLFGGVLSILGYFRLRRFSHRVKGSGWINLSNALYALLLGLLLAGGFVNAVWSWIGPVFM